MSEPKKRETAYKIRIGDLLRAHQVFDQAPVDADKPKNPRLLHVELGDKKIMRVNIIANNVINMNRKANRVLQALLLTTVAGR